jgi:acyl-CoA thioesterase-1
MIALFTFGDSILDCGRYNAHGVDPGQLIVSNDDRLFPEFRGRDLQSSGPARLIHRAVDGATVAGLAEQLLPVSPEIGSASATRQVALLTVGGNDLIRGLAADHGSGMITFEKSLRSFLSRPSGPVITARSLGRRRTVSRVRRLPGRLPFQPSGSP